MLLWTWNWFYFVNSFMFFNFFTYYFCLCFMEWYLLSPYKYYSFYDSFFSPLYACSLLKFLLFIFIFSFHSRILLNIWCFICFKSREFFFKKWTEVLWGVGAGGAHQVFLLGYFKYLDMPIYWGMSVLWEIFPGTVLFLHKWIFQLPVWREQGIRDSRDRGGSESWAVVTCLSFAAGFLSIERGHGAKDFSFT